MSDASAANQTEAQKRTAEEAEVPVSTKEKLARAGTMVNTAVEAMDFIGEAPESRTRSGNKPVPAASPAKTATSPATPSPTAKAKVTRAGTMVVTADEASKLLDSQGGAPKSRTRLGGAAPAAATPEKAPEKQTPVKTPAKSPATEKTAGESTIKQKLDRTRTMAATANEAAQLLESQGGAPETRTRKGQEKSDEKRLEEEKPEEKAKLARAGTMAATAAEGEKLVGAAGGVQGKTRSSGK